VVFTIGSATQTEALNASGIATFMGTALTIDQFYLILRLVPSTYQDMLLVAQFTGLRVGELLALRWEAVDSSGSA
jgi:integrase